MKQQRALRAAVVGMAMALGGPACAQAPVDDGKDRERIQAERAAVEAGYVQQVQLCAKKFIVTSCVDEARAKRHAALARLDQQQAALDQAQRARRAAERLQEIDSKNSAEEALRRDQAARERSTHRRDVEEPKPPTTPSSAAPAHAARAASSDAERADEEARARRAYDLKQLQAEAHRQEVERRNAERARKAKQGAALPTPESPAASKALPKTDAPTN